MFSPQIRWFLYGVLITTSLVSVITYASGIDGVFGDYFDNIIHDAVGCWTNTAITGFDTTPANFGKQKCTTFDNIVRTVLWVGTTPSGQAVVWFDVSGNPVYGDVNWHKDVSENISYTGAGNVGIGTDTPGATLSVSGSFSLTDGTQGNGKVLTSDASGNASWQVASGGGGGWIWENVPLTDTSDFDVQCSYIFTTGWILIRLAI